MMLDGKELGDYTDIPFRCGQSAAAAAAAGIAANPFQPGQGRADLGG